MCTVHVLQARRWIMTGDYGGRKNYLRRWSRMVELTVGLVTVLGGGDDETRWQQQRFRCVEIPIGVLFPRRFILSILFLPSPRLSLSVSLSISSAFSFLSFGRFSLYAVSFSLSVPPFFCPFSPFFPLLFTFRDSIYKGRGSGVDPAPSHRRVHVAHVATSTTTPAVVANGGVACGARLLRNIIMRWVAEHVGRKGRDKEKKTKKCLFPCCMSGGRRRRNSAASKQHRFVSFFFWKHMKWCCFS